MPCKDSERKTSKTHGCYNQFSIVHAENRTAHIRAPESIDACRQHSGELSHNKGNEAGREEAGSNRENIQGAWHESANKRVPLFGGEK
jgi:hypothetical protein